MELTLIQSKIYEIRGQRVMLDFDLAEMYGIETKRLKEAVRRNIKRFPSDFMFELAKVEYDTLRTQIASSKKRGGIRYLPFTFTEHGVSMLSSVLNSDIAIEINISIIRAFVAVRQLLANSPEERHNVSQKEFDKLKEYIEEVFTDYNDINEDTRMQLELINESLAELQVDRRRSDRPRNPIGFRYPRHTDDAD